MSDEKRYQQLNIPIEVHRVVRDLKEKRGFFITEWVEAAMLEKLERDEGIHETDVFPPDRLPSTRRRPTGNATLTPDEVVEIRETYISDRRVTQGDLAEEYGVSISAISNIVNGRTWAETDGPILD